MKFKGGEKHETTYTQKGTFKDKLKMHKPKQS